MNRSFGPLSFEQVVVPSSRTDGNQSNLRNAAYEALMEMIRHSPRVRRTRQDEERRLIDAVHFRIAMSLCRKRPWRFSIVWIAWSPQKVTQRIRTIEFKSAIYNHCSAPHFRYGHHQRMIPIVVCALLCLECPSKGASQWCSIHIRSDYASTLADAENK